MTSPFNWRGPALTAKAFRTRNDKPGTLPPIVLAGTPKWTPPKTEGKNKHAPS